MDSDTNNPMTCANCIYRDGETCHRHAPIVSDYKTSENGWVKPYAVFPVIQYNLAAFDWCGDKESEDD